MLAQIYDPSYGILSKINSFKKNYFSILRYFKSNIFKKFKVDFPEEVETISSICAENFIRYGLTDQTRYFSNLERGIIDPIREQYKNVRSVLTLQERTV